jgi:glutaredoxin
VSAISKGKARLTLYSRAYCHLCQDMLAALEALRGELSFELTVIDVDADPLLERQYNELVPVLSADGQELCHHFLDVATVRDYCACV